MPAKVKVMVEVVEGSKWPLNMRVLSSFEDNSATVALTRLEARKLVGLLVRALNDGRGGEIFIPEWSAQIELSAVKRADTRDTLKCDNVCCPKCRREII